MRKRYVLLTLLALLFAATNASAQGFGVYEHGTCMMARGGAGVAAPCDDGSAIFFNPAGIAFQTGQVISAGATVINPRGGFTPVSSGTAEDLNVKYYPVPSAYYAGRMGKLAIGAGLFAPYGLTTDWPLNNTWEGRFLGYKTSLKGIYVQPTVAYKVNDKFAVGGGIDISYASLELNQRVDLNPVPITGTPYTFGNIGVPKYTDFANIKLSGHSYHVGYHLAFQAKATPVVSIGARYLSRQRFTIDNGVFNSQQIMTGLKTPIALGPTIPAGTPIDLIVAPQFAAGGSLADNQSAQTSIVYPDQFVLGTAFKVGERTLLLFDYQFVHWSLFDQISITRANSPTPTVMTENYKNTHGLRIGVEHELNQAFTLRGGFITHTAAAPDETVTPLLPEGPRREFTVGIGAKLAKNLRADFAYQYLFQSDRAGRTIPIPSTGPINNGVYNFMSHLFGVTVVVMF